MCTAEEAGLLTQEQYLKISGKEVKAFRSDGRFKG